jgi:hypothetical protein
MMTKKLFLIILLLFSYSNLYAQSSGFLLTFALKGGYGNTASGDNQAIPKRDQYVYGGETMLGYHFGNWVLGASYEYLKWGQTKPTSETENINVAGLQTNAVLVIGRAVGNLAIFLRPYITSNFLLDLEDSNGEDAAYTSHVFPSYGIQFLYNIRSGGYMGLEFTSATYDKYEAGSTKNSLNKDNQVQFGSLMLVLGISF